MIGRIKELKNIGTFSNYRDGSIGFEKLTFIYGFNTYGKTTITDVLQSLKSDNSEIIKSRKTIPQQASSQKVVLTNKNQSEVDVKFENENWTTNDLAADLEIFGTEFIHKNLFTGMTIERENRENFTQFILGEQGVVIAEEIASHKRDLREKKANLRTKIPNFVKNKNDSEIKIFLELDTSSLDLNRIVDDLLGTQVKLKGVQEQLNEPNKILSLEEPSTFSAPDISVLQNLEEINNLLQTDYTKIKDEVVKKLQSHIESNLSTQEAEKWLKHGLQNCNKDNCPFCGQPLKNARELIEIYHSYFDPEYSKFIDSIIKDLSLKIQAIERTHLLYKSELQETLTKLNQFKLLIPDEDFQKDLEKLQNGLNNIDEVSLSESLNKVIEDVKAKVNLKSQTPHKKIEVIRFDDFEKEVSPYIKFLKDVKNLVENTILKIKNFKKAYENTEDATKEISELTKKITTLEYEKARLEQDAECTEYANSLLEIKQLEDLINQKQEQLSTEQSDYLDKYYTEINKLFKKLGSKNFKLEKITDTSGHLPVYSLKVKFHNQEISNNELKNVFSESDRRALALSIFWAKITLMESAQKSKRIIILDDPVTSFDDNRVTNTILLFKEALPEIGQLIVLTHYPIFIRRFCEITKESQITTKFIEIAQNDNTSLLCNSNREKFTCNDFEKIFFKIYDFVNQRHSDCIKTDLRPFFENLYLRTVFAKQICDKNVDCSTLENMIDGIFDDETVRNKMHEFRTTLNPDSHVFTSNNPEDVRNFAAEMIEYLFSFNPSAV